VSGLLQPQGLGISEADEAGSTAPTAEESIDRSAIDASGPAFSQPEVQIPEPQVPISIGTFTVESGARATPVPKGRRQPVQTGGTPVLEARDAAPADSNPAAAPAAALDATGAAPAVSEAAPAGNDAEATPPTESLLVTAPAAAAAGSVVDRARMAAVDRVAQENGVKLVWLNPPVLEDASGSAPRVPSAEADISRDSQARAIAVLQPQPEFPDRARLDSIEGWVTVSYVIGRDGRVYDVAIVAAQPRNVFEGAVRKAVRSWRFEPVTVDGRAVEQKKTQTIRFSLSDGAPAEAACAPSTGSRICRAPDR
jgi:protein TonB